MQIENLHPMVHRESALATSPFLEGGDEVDAGFAPKIFPAFLVVMHAASVAAAVITDVRPNKGQVIVSNHRKMTVCPDNQATRCTRHATHFEHMQLGNNKCNHTHQHEQPRPHIPKHSSLFGSFSSDWQARRSLVKVVLLY